MINKVLIKGVYALQFLKFKNKDDFNEIVKDLLADPDVQSMRELPQHSKTCNCLDHSIYVAYLSFLICRRLGLDYKAAARAGLLHDFALRNWDEEDEFGIRRLWVHPKLALENAAERYELSAREQDIIVKHMWPLTPVPPRHWESFFVGVADKLCALMEMSRLYKAFRVKKHLHFPRILPFPAPAV